MKQIFLSILSVFISATMFGQTIEPAEDIERCPTVNYPNGAGQSHTITLPDSAKFYSIGTTSNCNILFFNNNVSGEPFKATCTIQFKDQSAGAHSFEIKKGSTVVKTFTFTRIKSIADRTLSGVANSVNVPFCTTTPFGVTFSEMKYRKTGSSSSSDDWGAVLPFYEYQLPAGWTIVGGFVGNSGTPGLYIGTNNVQIQPDLLNAGEVKVRALNAPCDPNAVGLIKQSQWSIVVITGRSALNLKVNNAETISLNCGDNRPLTFTVENGSAATCASFEWDVVNRGWLDNTGNPINGIVTTSTPSITLIPENTLANPPKNVVVTIKSGSQQLKDSVLVSFTNTIPSLLIAGDISICSSKIYELQTTNGFPLLGNVAWSAAPATIVNLVPNPFNSKQVTVSRNGTSNGVLALTANYTYPGCNTNTNKVANLTVGTPKASTVSKYETPEGEIYLTVTYVPGATYNYYENGVLMAENSDNHYLTFVPCNTSKIVQHETVNECGVSVKGNSGVNRACTNNIALKISPNPASNTIGITLSEEQTTSPSGSSISYKDIREVQVVDKEGILLKRQFYPLLKKSVTLNIYDLKSDVYLVRVFDGIQWYTKQIIKN